MSATKHPACPGPGRADEEILTALREHLGDEDAEIVAARMKTPEQDEEDASDWHVVKHRILHGTPKP